jgi:hypothetical protein
MEGKSMLGKSHWIGKAIALAVMAIAGVAVMAAFDPAGLSADTSRPTMVCAAPENGAPAVAQPDQQGSQPEPAAICRLRPECSVDSDCDAKCGAGQGKCVHSNCPIRICKCS